MVGVLVAILGIVALIISHEYGHYLAGRLVKIPIYEFAVGMGPEAISWKSKRTGTKFSVRVLPVGGFCSFDDPEEMKKRKALSGVLDPSLDRLPIMKRLFVYAAGPLMNVIVAFFISFIAYAYVGKGDVLTEIRDVTDGGVAQEVGLEGGDDILILDGVELNSNGNLMTEIIRNGDGKTLVMVYRQGSTGELVETKITPYFDQGTGLYRIGTYQQVRGDHLAFGYFLQESWKDLGRNIQGTVVGIVRLCTGGVDLDQATGVVGAVGFMQGYANRDNISIFLHLLSLLSVNLGLMNMLPIPVLDGGKCLIATVETVLKRKINEKWNMIITGTAFCLLMVLMFVLAVKDTLNIIGQ